MLKSVRVEVELSQTPGSPAWWQNRLNTTQTALRKNVGRPQISHDKFIEAAIEIIDVRGVEALSLRQLAQRVGSGTATLYRHFTSKEEIVVCAVDYILGEAPTRTIDTSNFNWQQICHLIGVGAYKGFLRHPNFIPLIAAQVPIGPNAMAKRERAIAALLVRGLTTEFAAKAYSSLVHYSLGHAIQFSSGGSFPEARSNEFCEYYRSLDKTDFPAVVAVAEHLPSISDEDEFEFGLNSIINGLEQLRNASI